MTEAMQAHVADLMARVRRSVEQYGLHVTFVAPGVGDPDEPVFAYTTGLFDLVGKEIIVFGLPQQYAHAILSHIHKWLDDGTGNNIDEDHPYTNFIDGKLPVKFRECIPELVRDRITVTRRHYDQTPPVVQLVLPDMNGLFPEDEGYDHDYMDSKQPRLYVKES